LRWPAAFVSPAQHLPWAKFKSFADNRRRISMSLFPVGDGSSDSALEKFFESRKFIYHTFTKK